MHGQIFQKYFKKYLEKYNKIFPILKNMSTFIKPKPKLKPNPYPTRRFSIFDYISIYY